jgi:hypothetical protein
VEYGKGKAKGKAQASSLERPWAASLLALLLGVGLIDGAIGQRPLDEAIRGIPDGRNICAFQAPDMLPLNILQVRGAQVAIVEDRAGEIRVNQAAARQIGGAEVCLDEFCTIQRRVSQVGRPEI